MRRAPAPRFSAWLIWLVGLVSLLFVAFVTLLDASCFFEISFQLRFLAAAIYLGSPVLVFMRCRRVQAIAAVSVIWMLVVLPHVRWNYEKSFYADARRIEVGMTAAEVRQIMSAYLELGRNYLPTAEEQEWLPAPPDPRYEMIFLHSAIGWTDHCEVRFDPQGRVRNIHIEKD